MTSPVFEAGLELRAEGDGTRRLKGRFPYKKRAVIDSGGGGRRPKKEEFGPSAFSFAVDDPERDIHLLIGHSFDRPLASKKAGTLILRDSAVAPPEAVPVPEETVDEDPREGNALIRTIFAAVLFELSMVTRPAYHETEADLRAFDPTCERSAARYRQAHSRWR